MMKKIRKQNTNLSLDPQIKKFAMKRAKENFQSLSALITQLLIKELRGK